MDLWSCDSLGSQRIQYDQLYKIPSTLCPSSSSYSPTVPLMPVPHLLLLFQNQGLCLYTRSYVPALCTHQTYLAPLACSCSWNVLILLRPQVLPLSCPVGSCYQQNPISVLFSEVAYEKCLAERLGLTSLPVSAMIPRCVQLQGRKTLASALMGFLAGLTIKHMRKSSKRK